MPRELGHGAGLRHFTSFMTIEKSQEEVQKEGHDYRTVESAGGPTTSYISMPFPGLTHDHSMILIEYLGRLVREGPAAVKHQPAALTNEMIWLAKCFFPEYNFPCDPLSLTKNVPGAILIPINQHHDNIASQTSPVLRDPSYPHVSNAVGQALSFAALPNQNVLSLDMMQPAFPGSCHPFWDASGNLGYGGFPKIPQMSAQETASTSITRDLVLDSASFTASSSAMNMPSMDIEQHRDTSESTTAPKEYYCIVSTCSSRSTQPGNMRRHVLTVHKVNPPLLPSFAKEHTKNKDISHQWLKTLTHIIQVLQKEKGLTKPQYLERLKACPMLLSHDDVCFPNPRITTKNVEGGHCQEDVDTEPGFNFAGLSTDFTSWAQDSFNSF